MHTEHLQNVKPSWIAFGWFLGAAVFALLFFAMIATGLISRDAEGGGLFILLAMFLGFMVGGYFTGWRVGAAPILHAVGIGLFTVVVWFVANLLSGEPLDAGSWNDVSPEFAAGVVLLQIFAAAMGARIGSRKARTATAPAS